ncbi:RNA-guided endonuclease InsQ/TnpB family protein [Planktothrix prolifica]|uniref:RNA-guided endonuclease InsQ/TnpB family protein n=1 Tax=Planktothrix prolifica TaxID=54307 RepID=UPI003C6DD75A
MTIINSLTYSPRINAGDSCSWFTEVHLLYPASLSDASWYQFTQWLDYYGKIWDKAVVAVSPNYTSQDCSSCGYRVKKSLSTRTHSCANCGIEICRDTNAAINILKKGMGILGIKCQNSTFGQKGSAEQSGKHGEKTASTIDLT